MEPEVAGYVTIASENRCNPYSSLVFIPKAVPHGY